MMVVAKKGSPPPDMYHLRSSSVGKLYYGNFFMDRSFICWCTPHNIYIQQIQVKRFTWSHSDGPVFYRYMHLPSILQSSFRRAIQVQVTVALNFGVTDYGSQGRSRDYNSLDPSGSRNRRLLYTYLSCGTSWKSMFSSCCTRLMEIRAPKSVPVARTI